MLDPDALPPPDDPERALAAVVALRRLADRLERSAIDEALVQGWTWARVAEALGVTRQAAHKRYAKRAETRSTVGRRARR